MWEFAAGCIRTYRLLAERARAFDADPRVREAMAAAGVRELAEPTVGRYTREAGAQLSATLAEADALAGRGCRHEALDQLLVEQLLGAFG